ncbi:hypothetical protein BCR44DRAFT_310042 [Catenaria anguillulae PL171]|uniref:Uncharacterized protein n=1 Tax=Catenaria anguillulae PL171 TaxID=765915 RepID=A0A1Y2HUK5_9FUNG|nr:hypothetical protein BCR44DRAFT_310042 [Catenaria anguillulae PL171]
MYNHMSSCDDVASTPFGCGHNRCGGRLRGVPNSIYASSQSRMLPVRRNDQPCPWSCRRASYEGERQGSGAAALRADGVKAIAGTSHSMFAAGRLSLSANAESGRTEHVWEGFRTEAMSLRNLACWPIFKAPRSSSMSAPVNWPPFPKATAT